MVGKRLGASFLIALIFKQSNQLRGRKSRVVGDLKREEKVKNKDPRASLVAQWLGVRLPMQGTRVQSLVPEDPTCCGAAGPVHHNYQACSLEPMSHNY